MFTGKLTKRIKNDVNSEGFSANAPRDIKC